MRIVPVPMSSPRAALKGKGYLSLPLVYFYKKIPDTDPRDSTFQPTSIYNLSSLKISLFKASRKCYMSVVSIFILLIYILITAFTTTSTVYIHNTATSQQLTNHTPSKSQTASFNWTTLKPNSSNQINRVANDWFDRKQVNSTNKEWVSTESEEGYIEEVFKIALSHGISLLEPPASWHQSNSRSSIFNSASLTSVYTYSAYGDILALVTNGTRGVFTGIKIVSITRTRLSARVESWDRPRFVRLILMAVLRTWERVRDWFIYVLTRLTNQSTGDHPWCHMIVLDQSPPFYSYPDNFSQNILKNYFTRAYKQELPESHGYEYTAAIYYCPVPTSIFTVHYNQRLDNNGYINPSKNNTGSGNYVTLEKYPIAVRLTSEYIDDLKSFEIDPYWFTESSGSERLGNNNHMTVFHHIAYPNTKLYKAWTLTTPNALKNLSNVLVISDQSKLDNDGNNLNKPKISVCIPPLFGALNQWPYVLNFVQSLEWNNLMGASEIFLYRVPNVNGRQPAKPKFQISPNFLKLPGGQILNVQNANIDRIIKYYQSMKSASVHSYAQISVNQTPNQLTNPKAPSKTLIGPKSDYFRTHVKLRVWQLPSELVTDNAGRTKIQYNGQVANIQDCLFRNMNGASDLVIFQDFDEIFYPQKIEDRIINYSMLFNTLEQSLQPRLKPILRKRQIFFRNWRRKRGVCGYVFRSAYMDIFDHDKIRISPSNNKKFSLNTVSYNKTHFQVPLSTYRRRLSPFFPAGIRSKFAVYPDRLLSIGIHEPHLDLDFFTTWLFGPHGIFGTSSGRRQRSLLGNFCAANLGLVQVDPLDRAHIRHFSTSIDDETAKFLLHSPTYASGTKSPNLRDVLSNATELTELPLTLGKALTRNMVATFRGLW